MNAEEARYEREHTFVELTDEEVAAWLSAEEGHPVPLNEVRGIIYKALRKLRAEFMRRGLTEDDLMPR